MIALKTIRRVTIYADASLEAILLHRFQALGARGYTVTECRGKGEHVMVENPFASNNNTRVRIETLVVPEVAEKILLFLQAGHFQKQAVAACMETVQVAATERV